MKDIFDNCWHLEYKIRWFRPVCKECGIAITPSVMQKVLNDNQAFIQTRRNAQIRKESMTNKQQLIERIEKIMEQLEAGGNIGNIVNPKPGVLHTKEVADAIATAWLEDVEKARAAELEWVVDLIVDLDLPHTSNEIENRIATITKPKEDK